MKFQVGDMWSAYDASDLFLITTNATLGPSGLIMGAGIALEARNKFPGLDAALGAAVKAQGTIQYGLIVSPNWPTAKLGAFQTKVAYDQKADLKLIVKAATLLAAWCAKHPGKRVDLNAPGVGLGKLCWHDVMTAIGPLLPAQVNVWVREPWDKRAHYCLDKDDLNELAAIGHTPQDWRRFTVSLCPPDPDTYLYTDGGDFGYRPAR